MEVVCSISISHKKDQFFAPMVQTYGKVLMLMTNDDDDLLSTSASARTSFDQDWAAAFASSSHSLMINR